MYFNKKNLLKNTFVKKWAIETHYREVRQSYTSSIIHRILPLLLSSFVTALFSSTFESVKEEGGKRIRNG